MINRDIEADKLLFKPFGRIHANDGMAFYVFAKVPDPVDIP